jgi:hypothetical protein
MHAVYKCISHEVHDFDIHTCACVYMYACKCGSAPLIWHLIACIYTYCHILCTYAFIACVCMRCVRQTENKNRIDIHIHIHVGHVEITQMYIINTHIYVCVYTYMEKASYSFPFS